MFRPYVRVLRTPHTALPFVSSFLGSLPITMLSLGVLLLIQSSTGSFIQAGFVSGALSAGNGLGLIVQGRLIDRHGQTVVLIPTGILCGSALVALTIAASSAAPMIILMLLAGIAGASIPAVITSMRVLIPELITEPDLRQTGYAVLGTQFQLAMISGPLLVSALLVVAGPAIAVLIAAGLAIVGGLVFAATPASRRWRPAPTTDQVDGLRLRPAAIVTQGLLTLLLANTAAGLAAGLISVAITASAVAAGITSLAGLLFAAQSAGDILGGFVYGGRRWRMAVPDRLIMCQAGTVIMIGLLAVLAGHPVGMLPVMFGIGLFQAPGGIASSTLLDAVARKGALGLSYTSLVGAGLGGTAIGSSIGGTVQEATSTLVLFLIAAGTTAAAVAQTVVRRRTLTARP